MQVNHLVWGRPSRGKFFVQVGIEYPFIKEKSMASSKRSSGKAKLKSSAKSARPAKLGAHKKARKLHRKATVKHAGKATRSPSGFRSDDQYMKFSGKFTVRLPKSLHQALVERAEKEGVSLNLFVTNALSRTVAVPGKHKR